MALYQFLNHQNQVRESSCSDDNVATSHGLSKSQLCLHKILHIIASYHQPQEGSKETSLNLEFEENRRINIDLNMGLSPSWPVDVDENHVLSESASLSACSFVENDLKNNDSSVEFIGNQYSSDHDSLTIRAISEEIGDEGDQGITKVKEEDKSKESIKVVSFQNQKDTNKDCLALLIEAAEVISGQDKESERQEQVTATTGSKSSCKCSPVVGLYEESTTDPVVRSKRGRNHMLPCRYRDSSVLLEPWKRRPRPQKGDSKKRKSR